jgi:hypothetical protein
MTFHLLNGTRSLTLFKEFVCVRTFPVIPYDLLTCQFKNPPDPTPHDHVRFMIVFALCFAVTKKPMGERHLQNAGPDNLATASS